MGKCLQIQTFFGLTIIKILQLCEVLVGLPVGPLAG
jgi:hypothetical protein